MFSSFISFYHFGSQFSVTANKKAKLINGTSSAQHNQLSGSASLVSSDEYQTFQQFERNGNGNSTTHPNGCNSNNSARSTGPNLVNKQLVLPFVPPSFPNGTSDGNNHLIKPSEYLKSISDKRSSGSSGRWVNWLSKFQNRYDEFMPVFFFLCAWMFSSYLISLSLYCFGWKSASTNLSECEFCWSSENTLWMLTGYSGISFTCFTNRQEYIRLIEMMRWLEDFAEF